MNSSQNALKFKCSLFFFVKSEQVLEESKLEIKGPSEHEWKISSIVIEEPLSGYI